MASLEVKVASPSITLTLPIFKRPCTPPTKVLVMETFLAITFFQSMPFTSTLIPRSPMCFAASMASALCKIALVGMQPMFKHVPPSLFFSTKVTSAPNWDALIAAT